MKARSVRFRLTVWYAVLLLAALAVFGGTIWLTLRARLFHELDEEIAASAIRFRTYFLNETANHPPAEITDELQEYCQALPPSTSIELHGRNGYSFVFGRKRNRHTQLQFGVYTLEVSESPREIDHTLDLLGLLLLSLTPLVVAIACIGGAWMSRRALRPVDELTDAAKTIGIENLSQRLPVPPTGDEIERLTEVWNTMLARLESAVGTLSQFAADASHELRTPLAVIRTSAELSLRRDRSPEAYRDSLAEIVAEAERMTQMVEDLLLLARGGEKNAGMPMEAVDLRDVVGEVFRTEISSRIVTGNRPALRRLFLALRDNAIKYSPEGSRVEIALRDGAVEVRDHGIGIPAADLPHIFRRFYRSDKARSNGGHGLGLSLAQNIAEAHHGKIAAESKEGEGSLFRVFIPER